MRTYHYLSLATIGLIASAVLAVPAFAETNTTSNQNQNQDSSWGMRQGTGMRAYRDGEGLRQGMGSSTPSIIQGNGQPVVGGAVTAINGSTLTVTNKSNVTYTVEVGSATIEKANKVGSLSDIAVGDNVVIQGTVNGTNITASSVMDGGAQSSVSKGSIRPAGGFWAGIGGFFKRLFGFF